jgi:hypothetical protein
MRNLNQNAGNKLASQTRPRWKYSQNYQPWWSRLLIVIHKSLICLHTE